MNVTINAMTIICRQVILFFLFLIVPIISSIAQPELLSSIGFDTTSFNDVFKKLNFNEKNIVVIGEAHKMRNMFTTEVFMVESFAKKGYETIFLECGKSEAKVINMFMQTGDTSLLRHTRAKDPDYKKFLQSLYELKHKNNYPFVFKGFDFERPRSTSYLFSTWFDTTIISDNSFKQQVSQLLSIKSSGISSNTMKEVFAEEEIFQGIRSSFPKFETNYQEVLKENFNLFRDIVFNVPPLGNAARDSIMNSRIITEEKAGGLSKAIIIVGSYHVCNDSTRFIPLLSKELPENFSMTVFALIYRNCRNFNDEKKISSEERFLKYLEEKQTDEPLIHFKPDTLHLVPSDRKNMSTIIMGFYNQ
jgi:hypothetical protein